MAVGNASTMATAICARGRNGMLTSRRSTGLDIESIEVSPGNDLRDNNIVAIRVDHSNK